MEEMKMAMATEMYCDGCNKVIHHDSIRTKGSMIRSARKQGWSVGKWDLCPYCRKNKKKLKEQGYIH